MACNVFDAAFCDNDTFPGFREFYDRARAVGFGSCARSRSRRRRREPCAAPAAAPAPDTERWDLPLSQLRARAWKDDVRNNFTHERRSWLHADRVIASDPEGCYLVDVWDPATSTFAFRGDLDLDAVRAALGVRATCCVQSFFNGRTIYSTAHKVACWTSRVPSELNEHATKHTR